MLPNPVTRVLEVTKTSPILGVKRLFYVEVQVSQISKKDEMEALLNIKKMNRRILAFKHNEELKMKVS